VNCAQQAAAFDYCRMSLRAIESLVRMLAANTSVTRTLERARHTLGGVARLADYLGVSQLELNEWLAGRRKPPTTVYTRALDVVARGPFAGKKLS
jgi:DNA-binding transcriptional regulator YiaG